LEVAQEFGHVVRVDDAQKVYVVVRVEARHLIAAHWLGPKHLHLAVQAVVDHEVVRHADAVRLHRVALPVVVVADLGWAASGGAG
jgi:hypothetical protein